MHKVKATPENVHIGFYSASLKPVLAIRSGEEVEIETSRCDRVEGVSEPMRSEMAALADKKEREGAAGPHALTGPIYLEGAAPGDVVELRIKDIRLRTNFGLNKHSTLGILSQSFSNTFSRHFFCLDGGKEMVENVFPGISVPLRPFFGNLGVAPPVRFGPVNSIAPGIHGGNLDIKDLVAGVTVYLPVLVKGALFSCGDGHACQADGEADGTAMETPLTGLFQFILRKDLSLRRPCAETPTHYMTIAYHKNLKTAARLAVKDMVSLLSKGGRLTEEEAYCLVSLVGEMHVSQLVNVRPGVHFMVPKRIFGESRAPSF